MIRVEHELHGRRRGRNMGVGLILGALVVIIFGLSAVKITLGQNIERFDHVVRPSLEPKTGE